MIVHIYLGMYNSMYRVTIGTSTKLRHVYEIVVTYQQTPLVFYLAIKQGVNLHCLL